MIHLKLLKPDSIQSGSIKMGTFTHCACAQAKHEQIVKLWGKISLQTDVNFTIFIYGMYTLYSSSYNSLVFDLGPISNKIFP